MKKIWLVSAGIVVILGMMLLAGCNSGAGPDEVKVSLAGQQAGINVSGVGKVMIKPDLAVLSLGIESQETSVAEAQSKGSTAMDAVIRAVKDQGVEEKDIQTQYFNISQVTRWDNYGEKNTVIGYRVTNTVVVKVRDVAKAGAIIDAVVVAGGDLARINNIDWTVEEPSTIYKQARVLAMKYAKEKAQQMADEGGVKLGDITAISENSNTYYQPYGNYLAGDSLMAVPAPTIVAPISIGQLEISTTVQVTYSIN
jgi:uncharacterized protein YggE